MKLFAAAPLFFLSATLLTAEEWEPKPLIEEAVEAMGGRAAFYAKQGVRYTYTYRKSDGKKDVSIETYRFGDEFSKARYSHRDLLFPEMKGELVQIFDGKFTRTFLDGNSVKKEDVAQRSDFLRKTNFYWFAMMFKLLDPGLIYTYQGNQEIDGVKYRKVDISFEDGVGDVKDTYLVFINEDTKLIDFFLFTVMDFGIEDPLLMKVGYEEIDGILLPTKRKYIQAEDWRATHDPDGDWVYEISTDVEFGNFIQ
ncbi:MAG: hypothetical protein AAF571_04995 [Verrucomicrobiota bacterium]